VPSHANSPARRSDVDGLRRLNHHGACGTQASSRKRRQRRCRD
jgi:hypothetical protein